MYDSMKKLSLSLITLAFCVAVEAQGIATQLTQAFQKFESDPQMKSGIASLYVIDAGTGGVVFEKNGMIGLAPASTQKVITSASAYILLGNNFRYRTELAMDGNAEGGKLRGPLYIKPSGDPTLGSWRWNSTREEAVIGRMKDAIRKAGITQFTSFLVDDAAWPCESIPDGWIWQDIGNYYGAGADALNWRENQYDLYLRSGGNLNDPVKVGGTKPELYNYGFTSLATSAAKGTGDNAYIYFPLKSSMGIVRGTIPVNESRFVISGAMPSGREQFLFTLADSLSSSNIRTTLSPNGRVQGNELDWSKMKVIHVEESPTLDSIVFWFNRKSINLYGEALLRTMALKEKKKGCPDEGVDVVRELWKGRGIEPVELNMVDGSGLSPLNRVTTHAQATILLQAKRAPWFSGFYLSLPEYNGMKMKSGTISGVKAFTGYHKSASGKEYIFSFLVNNYNGPSSGIVQKMYQVLDVLK
jgi:D-alanyl-D-alanine carboxypeptidase/D-alanyl-D-alanine-endopeptidase (penicillin-binding protein 4)